MTFSALVEWKPRYHSDNQATNQRNFYSILSTTDTIEYAQIFISGDIKKNF